MILDVVSPSEYSLDVAEPCLPSSQTCGLEDREPGRSWSGQRKEEEEAGLELIWVSATTYEVLNFLCEGNVNSKVKTSTIIDMLLYL